MERFFATRDWLWGLLLAAAVIVVYTPSWWAGYVWDDDDVLTANQALTQPGGFAEIWTTRAADICPLTISTFWIEHQLWGFAPLPYHLVNVLLQCGCAVALWRLLLRLRIPGAWLGAALWAVHPVQVESVAWISEMKNTESGLFYLLALLFFVRALRRGFDWNYFLSLLFAAAAMASKSSTVILPLIFMLCVWWREHRWSWHQTFRVAPLFFMSIASALASLWTQRLADSDNPLWAQSLSERLVLFGKAVWFYLFKLLWPDPLLAIYPRWKIDAGDAFSYFPTLAIIILVVALCLRRDPWARPSLFALLYFLAALLPVLGLVNISYFRHTFVADHFQYLADIGPIALVAGIVAHFTDSENWELPWLAPVVGSILMLALALVSWNRAWAFQDETTLWTDTLEKNPGAWEAHNYFGEKYLEAGQLDDAMGEIEATLKIFPFSSEAHNNLGNVLAAEGNLDGGIAEFQKAIAIFPGYAAAISNLGNALLRKGEYQQAQDEYRKALALKSDNPGVINNLGMALYDEGHLPEAEQSYRRALALNPNLPYAHGNLGVVLAQQGRVAEARAEFHRALEIYPGDQRARAGLAALDGTPVKNPAVDEASRHDQLGTDLARKGSMEEAMAEFQKSLQLNPHDAEAHNFIGILLAQSGKLDLAIAEFKEALRIAPDYPGARENLAHAQSQLAGQKQQDAQP